MESFRIGASRVRNGTYHHIPSKRLHLYVAGVAERLNIRDVHAPDRMAAVIRNMVGRTPTCKQLTAKNTLCGV